MLDGEKKLILGVCNPFFPRGRADQTGSSAYVDGVSFSFPLLPISHPQRALQLTRVHSSNAGLPHLVNARKSASLALSTTLSLSLYHPLTLPYSRFMSCITNPTLCIHEKRTMPLNFARVSTRMVRGDKVKARWFHERFSERSQERRRFFGWRRRLVHQRKARKFHNKRTGANKARPPETS